MVEPLPGQTPRRRARAANARGRRLRADLAAVLVRDNTPELRLFLEWLGNWSGLGLIVAGMTHQGRDVQLTADAARDWRATSFPVGIAHSIVAARRGSRHRGGRCSRRRGRPCTRAA